MMYQPNLLTPYRGHRFCDCSKVKGDKVKGVKDKPTHSLSGSHCCTLSWRAQVFLVADADEG